jgi:hypothetical protein
MEYKFVRPVNNYLYELKLTFENRIGWYWPTSFAVLEIGNNEPIIRYFSLAKNYPSSKIVINRGTYKINIVVTYSFFWFWSFTKFYNISDVPSVHIDSPTNLQYEILGVID